MSRVDGTSVLKSARDNYVRYVRLQFTDLFGTIKNLEIPASQLDCALAGEIMFDGSSVQGFGRIEESDMYLKADPNTWIIFPWVVNGSRIARLICDIYTPDGMPFAGNPRAILQRAIAASSSVHLREWKIAVELEFFLFRTAPSHDSFIPNDDGGYFDIAPIDAGENCRRDIVMALKEIHLPVASSHHETGPGQHEIDLDFCGILETADHISTLKTIVKTIARQHGLHATFMPKPLTDADGSGMHLFIAPASNTSMTFTDTSDGHGMSGVCKSFVAGLLFHATSMTAITNPLVNSYKRLAPGFEAPAYAVWSRSQRMPFIRVVTKTGVGTAVELRSPDASCNPYLALAVAIKAGMDGVAQEMVLPRPVSGQIEQLSEQERFRDGILRLPMSLEQALEALEEDEIMRDALGQHAFSHYVESKLFEWAEYRGTVHDWEIQKYLKHY